MKKSFRSKIPVLVLLFLILIAAALYILFFTSLPEKWGWRENKAVVGSCAGYDLTIDEVRYVTLLYRKDFESRYGADVWKNPDTASAHREELIETVNRKLKNNYAILAAAKEYLSKDELEGDNLVKTADAQIDELKSYYGDSFEDVLAGQNLTEEFLHFTLWVDAVGAKLYEKLDSNEKVVGFSDTASFFQWLSEGNCVYAQYVYLSNDEGEDPEENRALAEEIRTDLEAGVDIGVWIGTPVNDDLSNVAPRYFVRELCEDRVWQELKGLTAPGQVSRVIETGTGFYVFQSIQEPEGLLEARTADLFEEFKTSRKSRLVESFCDLLIIEWNERGKALDFVTLN